MRSRVSVIDFDDDRLDIQLLLCYPIDRMLYDSNVRSFMLDEHNWVKEGVEIVLKNFHEKQFGYIDKKTIDTLKIKIIGVRYDKYYNRILRRYKNRKVKDSIMPLNNIVPSPSEYIELIKINYKGNFFIPIMALYPLSKNDVFSICKKNNASFDGTAQRRFGLNELKANIGKPFWNNGRITYFSVHGLSGGMSGCDEASIYINIKELFSKTQVFSDPEVGSYPGEAGSSYFVINGIPRGAIFSIAVSDISKQSNQIKDWYKKGLIKDREEYLGPEENLRNDIKRLKIKV